MKTSFKKQTTIIVSVTVLAIGAAIILYAVRRHHTLVRKSDNVTQTQPAKENTQPQTRQETSEGSTFDVPNTVPKDAIKNYTLITENEEFKIRQEPGTKNYIITLYAIINNPSQYSAYQDQLREYKQNALKYLTDNKIDPSSISITYEPQEASSL